MLDLLAVVGKFFSPNEAPVHQTWQVFLKQSQKTQVEFSRVVFSPVDFSRVDFDGLAWVADIHRGREVGPKGDFEEVLKDWNLMILLLSWEQQDDEEGDQTLRRHSLQVIESLHLDSYTTLYYIAQKRPISENRIIREAII